MNQRDEQRVIETLRAYTGGLIVTEQDILTAGGRMRANLEPPSPRRRPLLIAVAAAFVLIVGLLAFQVVEGDEDGAPPAPATPSSPAERLADALAPDPYNASPAGFTAGAQPTARDLSGIWLLRVPYGAPLVVSGDLDWTLEQIKDSDFPATSALDGRTWTRNFDGGMCVGGRLDPQPWTASLASDRSLHLLFAGDTNVCTPADSREVWDRLAPGPSPVLDYLRETSADIGWAAATDSNRQELYINSNLQGLYINPENGHVLDVATDGSYWYLDSVTGRQFAPSDQGTLDLEAAAGTVAGSCNGESFSATIEVGSTPAVANYLESYFAVKITATGDSCDPGIGADAVWIRLS